MWKEKKTRTVKPEKHDPATCPMIVGKVQKSVRPVKPKEKIKSNSKCPNTTCETSGNIMKLRVNLMPVLAAAKEPVEEEEGKEEDSGCTSKKEPQTSSKTEPSVTKSEEQTFKPSDCYTGLNLDTDMKLQVSPQFVLPPITPPKPAPQCQKTKRDHTPLPPIGLSDQTSTVSSNSTIKNGCRGDGLVAEQVADSRPWIDNPLLSKSRSAEFRLPDISLSSLDALLQTVTQKLGRKRRGGGEGPWRHVQSDRLLMAVSEQHPRDKSVRQQIDRRTDNRNSASIEAVTEASVGGHSVTRQRSLPPLLSAPKPKLILTMTKKNLLTSNMLQ